MDAVFYAQQLAENNWSAWLPMDDLGETVMVVFIDIYGNEASELIETATLKRGKHSPKPTPRAKRRK
jgi:hypothetical protein